MDAFSLFRKIAIVVDESLKLILIHYHWIMLKISSELVGIMLWRMTDISSYQIFTCSYSCEDAWQYFFVERKQTTESAFFPSIHVLLSWPGGDTNFYLQQNVMKALILNRWNICRLGLSIVLYFYLPCSYHLFWVCVILDCNPFEGRNKASYTKHHQYVANNNDIVAGRSISSLLLSYPTCFYWCLPCIVHSPGFFH